MKVKNVLLTLIVLALFACSSDDLTNNLQDVNSEIQLEQNILNTSNASFQIPQTTQFSSEDEDGFILIGLGGINYGNCPEFMAPFRDNPSQQTGQLLDVRYDPSTPLDEINCIRKSFFEQFCYLRMFAYDPGDPYHDIWIEVENLTGCFRPNTRIDNFPLQNRVPPTSTDGVDGKTAVEKESDERASLCVRKPRNSSGCQ
ncbi:hypothetical protein GTQ40_14710 [Flavobacteriaceae bacterium R38]|nr:hypothetical protein [Flavobacteriaceae bacterium R38]